MTKKFRIWDGQKFLNEEEHSLYISQSGYLVHIDTVGEQSWASDNNKVSWWTGLTDSQGVEIYEGDIVSFQERKWTITFKNSGWFLVNDTPNKMESWWLCTAQNLKIIGNIFQTPELLEKC